MKISYNWLKELLSFNQSPNELAEVLTNTGLEVEHVESFCAIPGGLNGLVVGEVLSRVKHPNADKLSLATVDVGLDSPLSIVCGATNLAEGQKVVVATVGTTIHPSNGEGFTIKKAKLRGEVSEGMICAEDEIGLGNSHDGIMVLDKSVKVGTPVAQLYEIEEDYVFEIGLTPNRTDAMSHIGVAKDIAAALNVFNKKKVNVDVPAPKVKTNETSITVDVKVENLDACPRYSGVVVDKLKIKESPKWLQNKLLAVGVRPINNVVDITNYVLKEYGQALHAFDWNAVKGNQIIVKNLPRGTKFKTLDEVNRELHAEDLMICNAEAPMCIAGVFGGIDSGVTAKTTTIFLESAFFKSSSIRLTSTRHGLRTDAAQRYEKGADPSITMLALKRAVELLEELAEGQVASKWCDVYPEEVKKPQINLRLAKLNSLAGHDFKLEQVKSILIDLDFEILSEKNQSLELLSPLSRADVLREADVIEEVMRIYGFNNINTPSSVKSTLSFQKGVDQQQLKEQLSFALNGFGFSEIITNSITQSKFYKNPEQLVRLQNSMTSELDSMRASMIPEILNVLRFNINRKKANLKFFEFGDIYHSDHSQEKQLALFYTGEVLSNNWLSKKQPSSIFHLKGIVEALFKRLKLGNVNFELKNNSIQFLKNKNVLAEVYQLSDKDLSDFEIEQDVFFGIIHWNKLLKVLSKRKIRFDEISKFPEVSRDLAVILNDEISFESVKQSILGSGGLFLKEMDLFDVFVNEQKIGKGKKSYALNFKLQGQDKTLSDKEIDHTINKIIKTLEKEFNAVIRM